MIDCVYKIEEYAGTARRKKSTGKETWPGRKQVYRRRDADGFIQGDVLAEIQDDCAGQALLETVMRDGERLASSPELTAMREHAVQELATLPESMRDPFAKPVYPVEISETLKALAAKIDRATD